MNDDNEHGGHGENVIAFAPATDGKRKHRTANPLHIREDLQKHALTKDLVRFDEFTQRVMLERPIPRPGLKMPKSFAPRPWADTDDTALTEHLNARGFTKVGRSTVREVIELEARERSYHPVRDYLDSVAWDGTPRLSRFLVDHCGAVIGGETDKQREAALLYIESVTRCLFISAVARVMKPGCKVDHTAIIEGPQGVLKSSLLRALAVRDEWFSESLPHNLASRDARQHLAGVWIVELSEIAQFKRSEVEVVKDFISCQIDRFRPAYGHADVSRPRQVIFIGTTNADVYFHDTTGNRRFWPVKVTTIKLADIRPIIDQLWAEAVAAFRHGEKWWLSAKLEKIAAQEQDERLERDPWFNDIAAYVERRTGGVWFTTGEVLEHLVIPVARRERSHEMRVGAVLRQLGCDRKKRWDATLNKTKWAYQAPKEGREAETGENSEIGGDFNDRFF